MLLAATAEKERAAARTADAESRPKSEAEQRRDKALAAASMGALQLRASMKDPESFQLRSVVLQGSVAACATFRAKNSFGAELPSRAYISLAEGELAIEGRGDKFARGWNRHCTKAGGEDVTFLIESVLKRTPT